MADPVWLDRRVIEAVHDRLIAEHGGAPGLRDEGLLVSALTRPRQLAAYDQPDLCDLAAAYATAIVRNHPFIDGNKRTAFIAAYVFLARNGLRLSASEASATHTMLALAGGEMSEAAFAGWLRESTHAAG
jgi:death-on-curing protein